MEQNAQTSGGLSLGAFLASLSTSFIWLATAALLFLWLKDKYIRI